MVIRQVYSIFKQVHIANKVTPLLFDVFSSNISAEMQKIGESRTSDNTDVLGSLPSEREVWKYPYFIQDNRNPIGNFEVQGGSYPYLFSNVNDQRGTYNYFFPINSDDKVENEFGLEVASAVGAFIGVKAGEREIAGYTSTLYEEIDAKHLYFNMLLNPGSREILRSSIDSPAPRPGQDKTLQPLPEETINYLYLNVLGDNFKDNEKQSNEVFLVRDFGGGAGQRGYKLGGKIRPMNEDTKKELFKREILPLLRNYFEQALNWQKTNEMIEEQTKALLESQGVSSFDELDQGTKDLFDEVWSGAKKQSTLVQRDILPVALLQLLQTWVYNPDNEDVMYKELARRFNYLPWKLANGHVDFLYGGDPNTGTTKKEKEKRAESGNIVNAISNPGGFLTSALANEINPNIFVYLGFKESIEEQTGEEYDPKGVVENLAGSSLGLLGGFLGMNNAIAGEPELESLDIQERLQCFLMSGLLFSDGLTKDWGSYWNILKTNGQSISPLSGKFKPVNSTDVDIDGDGNPDAGTKGSDSWNAHNRIYPVTPKFDSREFMNKAIIGEDTKTVFENIAEDMPKKGNTGGGTKYDQIFKQLWWVHEEDGELKETRLFLSSKEVSESEDLASSKFERALEYLNNPVLTEREKAKRIKDLNLGLTRTVPDGDRTKQVPVSNITPDIVYAKLNEIQSKIEIEAKENDGEYYYVEQIQIDFKGTTPATARNDVTVEFQFNLSSMAALEKSMNNRVKGDKDEKQPFEVKLWDLITLPQTNELSKGFGRDTAKQFNPAYNRIRLKVAAKSDYTSNLIIDLNTVDYNFNRTGEGGETTMTVNMIGFFETVLNMPENDILTTPEQRSAREEAANKVSEAIKEKKFLSADASEEEIKAATEAIETAKNNEKKTTTEQRRSADALMQGMISGGQMHSFLVSDSKAVTALKDNSPRITENFVTAVSYGKSMIQSSDFFFFGDLLYYAMDAIYKSGTSDHHKTTEMMNMRYIVAPIEVPRESNGKIEYVKINPLCIPILADFFHEWFNDVVLKKNLSVYRIGIFIRELLDRLVNKIVYNTCFSGEKSLMMPPQIRDTFISTSESQWYKKDEFYFFNPDTPYNEPDKDDAKPFLKKSMFSDDKEFKNATEQDPTNRVLTQKNYCLIYPSYIDAISGLARVTKVAEKDTLKVQEYTPEIFYGRKNDDYNFITNMSLSKTNVPFLREARYSNTNYGSLSLLSNVYDLSFSFLSKGANTVLYPGVIINFVLLDWGSDFTGNSPYAVLKTNNNNYTAAFGDSNPHDIETRAHLLGMGGYFIISSVQYILGQTSADFEIKVSAKFNGMDGQNSKRSENDTREIDSDTSSASGEELVIGGDAATTIVGEGEILTNKPEEGDTSPAKDEKKRPPVEPAQPVVLRSISPEDISIIAEQIIQTNYMSNFKRDGKEHSFDSVQPKQSDIGKKEDLFNGTGNPVPYNETGNEKPTMANLLKDLGLENQSFSIQGTETDKDPDGRDDPMCIIYTANKETGNGTVTMLFYK